MSNTKKDIMKGNLLLMLDLIVYCFQFVLYLAMRIIKAFAWWVMIPKFDFWRKSEFLMARDITLILIVGTPTIAYFLIGWLITLIAVALIVIGVMVFLYFKRRKTVRE